MIPFILGFALAAAPLIKYIDALHRKIKIIQDQNKTLSGLLKKQKID